MRAHLGTRPLPLTRKLLHKWHTHWRPRSVLQTRFLGHTHTQTRTLSFTNVRVHGHSKHPHRRTQLYTYTHIGAQPYIHSRNKTRNSTLCAKSSRSRTQTCSSSLPLPHPFLKPTTHDLQHPQSQIIISTRAAQVGHRHTHALAPARAAFPTQAGEASAPRPVRIPGVAVAPLSMFCSPPRCWRRGEEGSWNNKGKLGRAQGGAAPAGPRGEPCLAGAWEATGSRAPEAGGGGKGEWGSRGGAAA